MLWWIGVKNPAVHEEAVVVAESEISLPTESQSREPAAPVVGDPPPMASTAPPVSEQAPPPANRPRPPRRAAAKPPPPSPDVVPQISLVRASGATQAQVEPIRRAVHGALDKLAACCRPLVQRDRTLKGTISLAFTAREGRVSALTVNSTIRDPSLRWCFRKALMGLPLAAANEAFDGHLEFFVVPRAVAR
ncbi:MAG: hypothetical protein JNL82_15260 [Myxococcales bacterium]|nr:hypothetical protein [Myxococcales bacterium]